MFLTVSRFTIKQEDQLKVSVERGGVGSTTHYPICETAVSSAASNIHVIVCLARRRTRYLAWHGVPY
jgi:hypothetical protein